MTAKHAIKSVALKIFHKSLILRANYLFNNYRKVIWIIGDGRSGTTWVSDIINHDRKYREMFEPFHPYLVDSMKFMSPHQYVRPDDFNEEVANIASDVFSGKFLNERVDLNNYSLVYKGLLIKDIFSNLFSYWASLRFNHVMPILLIRNPFSVAISKHRKRNWDWATDPLCLLNQKFLYEDYLFKFEDIIKKISRKNNYILNQIVIWSIINYVPLCQFKEENIHVCFYEDIFVEPIREMSNVFKYINGCSEGGDANIALDVIKRPSRVTTSDGNLLSGVSPILSWKNELTPQLIDEGFEILQCFGFEDLYDDKSMPNSDVLKKYLKKE